MAGVLLSGNAQADQLYDKLWGVKELFLIGFFLAGWAGWVSVDEWVAAGGWAAVIVAAS